VTEAPTEKVQFAYCSRLAPGNSYTVFGAVCRAARLRNLERGIGGVLLFDGECFLQWAHGPKQAVQDLFNAIRGDPRHHQMTVLLDGLASQAPAHSSWHAGFVDAMTLERFMARCKSAGAVEPEEMFMLFSQADLQPALPCTELEHSNL
jgi:Sensors of blue-light using FAD